MNIFQTIKRSLNSGKKAENGFISDLFMRRTMAALTSTFIFPSSSFFFSRLLCRLLSGAALHFFYGSASFDRQKRPLFLFEKMAPLFRMRAPPSQSVHLSRSLSDLLPFFFCFYKIQDSIGLKCFKIKCSKFTSLKLIFAFDCLIELEKNFKNEEKSGKFSRVHFEFSAIFSYFLDNFRR